MVGLDGSAVGAAIVLSCDVYGIALFNHIVSVESLICCDCGVDFDVSCIITLMN